MPNFNSVVLMGRITRDIELKYAATGTAIISFGIAVNSGYKDKEEVYFGEITVFGKTAEFVSKYARKGSAALVSGRLVTESWQDKNTGKKQSKTKIIADKVQLLSKTEDVGQEEQAEAPSRQQTRMQPVSKEDAPPSVEDPFEVAGAPDDDMPF